MRILLLATLLGLLAWALWYASSVWTVLDAPDMPATFYVAMGLGVFFSIVVGCGLMALVFYSSRHGYDERASGGRERRGDQRQ